MNGRVYDQNLGRFLSVDPIVQDGGSQALNPYSYIRNNPLSGTDPSGYASQKDECAGTKAGGCMSPTAAATLTGSHIKGASSGANIEVTLVNPTAAGMAELAVAMAGMNSGYVVQAASQGETGGAIAADKDAVGFRQPKPMDRPNGQRGEEKSPYAIPMYDGGQAAMMHADTELLAAGMFGHSFSDDESLTKEWADIVYPIARLYGVEMGTVLAREKKSIYLGPTYSDGEPKKINGLWHYAGGALRGKSYATIHTHPDTIKFSGATAIAGWGSLNATSEGWDGAGDLVTSYGRQADAFVVGPGREISGWRYNSFIKYQASTAAGWARLDSTVYSVRGRVE